MPNSAPRPIRGEFDVLAKVRAMAERAGASPGLVVGIGDDCALVQAPRAGRGKNATIPLLALTTDSMVEGVHYQRGWLTASELGRRAFRAAVSDIAAMGGRPLHVLLSLEIPTGEDPERSTLALTNAVSAEARRQGAALVGGNVTSGSHLAVTVTLVGECRSIPLRRCDAKAGDLLFVTGSLGGAAAGWRTLASQSASGSLFATKPSRGGAGTIAYRRPPIRIDFAAALAERGWSHAMIDLSDGLLQDLGHLAKESGVTIAVDPCAVPVHVAAKRFAKFWPAKSASKRGDRPMAIELALTGGEDYELAFTAPPARRESILTLARAHRVPISVVGFVRRGAAAVTDENGEAFPVLQRGFDHFGGKSKAPRTTRRPSTRHNKRGEKR